LTQLVANHFAANPGKLLTPPTQLELAGDSVQFGREFFSVARPLAGRQ
jgi:hypothetical protein